MRYQDGPTIEPGDAVAIDEHYRGVVVACIGSGRCLHGHEGWDYLGQGVMVDTDFAGLVHYPQVEGALRLLRRGDVAIPHQQGS